MKQLFKIIILSLFFGNIKAQNVGLDGMIKMGIANNKDIALALKNVEYQQSLVKTAHEMPKTAFELQYGNIQTPNANDHTFMAVQNFELPKIYSLRKQYNESLVKIGESALALQRNDLAFQIRNSVFELKYLFDLTKIYEQELVKITELESISIKKSEQGEIDKADVLSLGLKIKEFKLKTARLEIEKLHQENILKILLNTQMLPTINFENMKPNSDNGFDIQANRRMLLQQQIINSANIETEKTKYALKPSFKGGLVNQSMMGYKNQFILIGGMDFPIFRKAQKARVEAAKINESMKIIEAEKIENAIKTELETALQKNNIYNDSYRQVQNQILPQNEALMNIVNQKYKGGAIEYLEWYLPYNQYLCNKIELVNIDKERNLNYSIINYLKGNE